MLGHNHQNKMLMRTVDRPQMIQSIRGCYFLYNSGTHYPKTKKARIMCCTYSIAWKWVSVVIGVMGKEPDMSKILAINLFTYMIYKNKPMFIHVTLVHD